MLQRSDRDRVLKLLQEPGCHIMALEAFVALAYTVLCVVRRVVHAQCIKLCALVSERRVWCELEP